MIDLLIGDDLYGAMDGFLKCQDGIEQRLARRYFQDGFPALYDRTLPSYAYFYYDSVEPGRDNT